MLLVATHFGVSRFFVVMLHLLIDLDRTLWDFDGNADITYRTMFDLFELERLSHVDYHTFHERYRQINDMLWEGYRQGTVSKEQVSLRRFSLTLAAFGCDPESPDIIRLSLRMADYYVHEGTKQTGLMPGARELLEWLGGQGDRFSLSVITNGFSEAQLPKMRTSGIDRYFSHFFLSENLGFMKPDRRFFEAALKRLGATPDQCLVIGDDYNVDIAGAMAVGIPQVYYNLTGHPLSPDAIKPTYEITHLLQFKDILAGTPSSPRAEKNIIPPIHSRGYHPHIESQQYQFVTFRLSDSFPATQISDWKRELEITPATPQNSEKMVKLRKLIDRYEDAGYGSCILREDRFASVMKDALFFHHGVDYNVIRWCIMPNHVHVLIEVFENKTLTTIVKSWRSYTAHRFNEILCSKGQIWMKDYFDRYIRDDKHFRDVVAYIDNNPVKAGLVKEPCGWKWSSLWWERNDAHGDVGVPERCPRGRGRT